MKVRCSEINWDTSDSEGKAQKLPKTMILEVPPLRENEDQDSLTDELAEILSEKTGLRVAGFNHRIL